MAEVAPVPRWFRDQRNLLDAWVGRHAGTSTWSIRQVRPWSVVGRVGHGPWVKAVPPAGRHEVAVLDLLSTLGGGALPTVLASDRSRGWLLLADGGPVLRDLEGGPGALAAWHATLLAYARIQRASESVVEDLVRVGVADVRGPALGARLDELLADDDLTGRGRSWGLAPDDDARFLAVRERLDEWAKDLEDSPVRPAIQHDDLHGNNVFTDGPVVFDWGDAVVMHPFASMTTALRSIPHHSPGLVDAIPDLAATYLQAWADVAGPVRLQQDLRIARHLGAVSRAMAWARAGACEPLAPEDRDAPVVWLRALLDDPST